jgi:hypothetical protein
MANKKWKTWSAYKRGGQRVPGMFKRQEGGNIPEGTTNTSISPDDSTINTVNINRGDTTRTSRPNPWSRQEMVNLQLSNAIKGAQNVQNTIVNKKMSEMIMQMKLQNQSLEQQNQLLKTQIEKSELINSARNTKQKPGAKNTPKRRGGSVKAKKGKEKKIMMFAQSSGGMMRHGGSCGGPLKSMMKRTKRR